MNDKKVEELVEWVARRIQDRDADAGECYASWSESKESTRDYYRETARIVLSHPDLALILHPQHIDWNVELDTVKQSTLALVIPLAEVLKNMEVTKR